MKHLGKYAVLSAIGIIALSGNTGCGGESDMALLPSMYMGTWNGNWQSGASRETGTISLTVTRDGSMSGSMARPDGAGTFSGFVDKNGRMNAVASFPTGFNMVIGGSVTLSQGRLVGSFEYTQNGLAYSGFFDAAKGTGGGTGGEEGA